MSALIMTNIYLFSEEHLQQWAKRKSSCENTLTDMASPPKRQQQDHEDEGNIEDVDSTNIGK